MDRRTAALLLVAVVALASVVNATVFAYRWIYGTVSIAGPGAARGAACTGFYSATAQSGITQFLPNLGTNYDAPTYGTYNITVIPGDVVCEWGTVPYKLYESIEVSIPVTVGSWYIQDFYGFGYNGTATGPKVYAYFRVEDAAEIVSLAKLIIWNGTTMAKVTELNLSSPGAMTSVIPLNPGKALRLDLYLDSSTTGTVEFRVGVYVTQEPNESPSP